MKSSAMTQAKLCGASLSRGAGGNGAKMNLRKQPVNRNGSHGNPSKEDSKGNSKKRPEWLEQEASYGRRDGLGARGVCVPGKSSGPRHSASEAAGWFLSCFSAPTPHPKKTGVVPRNR